MLDVKDFSFFENQNSFDFKGFFIKTGSYWRWFLLGLIICLTIAHQINIRKQKIYSLDTTIAVKEENNPFFTSNTSLVFNCGGTSDKVQTIASTLRSRSHNEIVVDKLNFFIDYQQKQEYFVKDVYGETPFKISIEKNSNQLVDNTIYIKFKTPEIYELKITNGSNSVPVLNYQTLEKNAVAFPSGEFVKQFKVGQAINLPFLNWTVNINNFSSNYVGQEYMIKFLNFDNVVSRYQGIKIDIDEKAGSILKLSLNGTNKTRIVDYLNETVNTLIKKQLESKNLFADNSIKFIDTTLVLMEEELKNANNDLKEFSKKNNVNELKVGGSNYQTQLIEYDLAKDQNARKVDLSAVDEDLR